MLKISELYVTGLGKNGLIAGLVKIDFFPEKASSIANAMSALHSFALTL